MARQRPAIEDCLAAVPTGEQPELLAELIREEHASRWRAGELPTLTEYKTRFPDRPELVERACYTRPNGGGVPFALIEEIGAGGFGTVFRARDTELGRDVAFKVLKRDRISSAAVSRFEQEIQTLANLDHEGVVRVYHSGHFINGQRYVVMELVSGGTLRDLVRRQPHGVEGTEAAKIVQLAAGALHFVHSRGTPNQALIHRDLKLENILLDGYDRPKIADFGLAAAAAELREGAAPIGGTLAYSSPEQVRAFQRRQADVDRRSDIWALGVIMYELLTGKRPFAGNSNDEIMEAIERYEPTAPMDLNTGVPRKLNDITLNCLRKDPNERFQTAADLAKALAEWLDGLSAIPTPLDFSACLAQARRSFTDRPWLFDEVDAWAAAHVGERSFLIVGELGCGKSAFAGELIHRDRNQQQRIVAHHLCRHDWPDTRRVATFVRSIAGMLATRIEDYDQSLVSPAVREALRRETCAEDPASAFETAIIAPIAKARPPAEGVFLIVVDALDEADLQANVTIAGLVDSWSKRLPDWLRIVATVRRGDPIERDKFSNARRFVIDRDNTTHADDLKQDLVRFILCRLQHPNLAALLQHARRSADSVADSLLARSEANFLYVTTALDGLQRELYTLAELDHLPPGLHALYDAFFKRAGQTVGILRKFDPSSNCSSQLSNPSQKN